MKTLKNNKLLQIFIGVFSGVVLLLGCYFLGEKITFPETAFWNIAEPVILVGYMLIYMAALSILAIFAKSHNLKYMYYPAFATCLTSVLSAFLHWHIEDSLWLLVMPLTMLFGTPIRAMAKAIEKATTYYVTIEEYGYGSYEIEETYIWEYPALIIFLAITLVSVIAYQLYTENSEQDIKKARWRLTGTARTASIAIIISYSIFITLVLSAYYLPYCLFTDILSVLLAHFCIIASWLTVPITLPLVLIGYMLKEVVTEARLHSNHRLYFNPLVILAVILSLLGSNAMLYTMRSCF